MQLIRRTVAIVVALAGLLAFSGAGWAQTAPEQPAAVHVKAEKQIATLQERLANAQPPNQLAEVHTKVASRLLDMAQKALDLKNDRVAKVLADQADHMLTIAAQVKGVQQ
jgi:ABC-type uncharacterized transport system permease subunit